MDKEKQKDQQQEIAEIRNIIYSTMCTPSSGFPKQIVDRYVRGYRFGIVASALYDSGYRKADDVVDRLMNAKTTSGLTKKEIEFFIKHNEKVRQETAKEILKTLYDRTQNYHGDRTILTSDDIKELAEKYGVKID